MALQDYVPSGNPEFCDLLAHVAQTLPQYYSTLGISAATPLVAGQITDSNVFSFLCARQGVLT